MKPVLTTASLDTDIVPFPRSSPGRSPARSLAITQRTNPNRPWLCRGIVLTLFWLSLLNQAVVAQATEAGRTAFRVKIESAVVYAAVDGVDLLCDVYTPISEAEATAPRPVVVLIHGGAWSSGSRLTMGGHAMTLAKLGFVSVSIDYRLAPRWKFPTQLDDVRRAISWVADNHQRLGIDPERIGLFGYSAGGHLACLIGTLVDASPDALAATTQLSGDDRCLVELPKPLAICAGGPPCDLSAIPTNHGGLSFFLGGTPAEIPDAYLAASPVTHASAGDVPTLFIHGERDAIVPASNSEALFVAQQRAGVASEFLTIEKQGHMLTFIHPQTTDSMIDFFRRRLLPPNATDD